MKERLKKKLINVNVFIEINEVHFLIRIQT
jgi:hypothetical protein